MYPVTSLNSEALLFFFVHSLTLCHAYLMRSKQVYGSSVNSPVRQKCLAAVHKLLHFSTPDMLSILLKESNIASFLAGVLASKDPSVLMTALQISELLMQKLPNMFSKMFIKEGVIHAIELLIASDQATACLQPTSSTGKGEDLSSNSVVGAQPPKPRRGISGRRRSSGHSNDAAAEDPGGAYVSPVGSFPTATTSEPAIHALRSGLLATAVGAAKSFKETYFSEDSGFGDGGVTESMCKLKALCSKLNGDPAVEVKGKGKGKFKATQLSVLVEEQMLAVVHDILAEIGSGDGVSTFEFVESGVMMALLNYFSCSRSARDDADSSSAIQRQQALKRFKQFIGLSLPISGEQSKDLPLTLLVRKLQNALSSLERFPVVLSHGPRSSGGNASLAAGLSALTQPFKLCLCRAPGEKALRDYSSNVVLIEPLATLVAVEEFLWSRVRRQDGSPTSTAQASTSDAVASASAIAAATSTSTSVPLSECRPSTRSRSAMVATTPTPAGGSREIEGGAPSSSKGKGKMGSKSSTEAHNHFEHRGPETRNAAARRRAAAAGTSSFNQSQAGAGGDLENEEEELGVSPVEIDEAVAMEEDELSEDGDDDDEEHEEVFGEEPAEVCIGERVHDVQLGDAVEVGAVASTSAATSETPTQPSLFCAGLAGVNLGGRTGVLISGTEASGSRTGATVGSKGALSFAAAAMAGVASASANSVRANRDRRSLAAIAASNVPPRLAFYLNGRHLNRSLTIFQAIQRQAVTDENDEERYAGPDQSLGGGRRLWDEVYTITYQRVDSTAEKIGTGASSTIESKKSGMASDSRVTTTGIGKPGTEGSWQQASLLDGILQGELPCDLDKSNSTYHILLLLRALEALNRLAPRLRDQVASDAFVEGEITSLSEMKTIGPLVPQEEFLSSKLTPKLARQMQDALALCSGGLPAWCHQLTRACPFLFPFETRRLYFYSTAFGLSRALQRLQQQQNADGPAPSNDRELRVGRLQRQKVRVSRNQILDSATKVMEMYCGHKAVLEVEYFGEVGTGLGPTLEFYTLLSHELQKKSLCLWRSDSILPNIDTPPRDTEMQDAEIEAMDESSSVVHVDKINVQPNEVTVEYVHAPRGLFPRPWHPSSDNSTTGRYAKVIEHFRLLGRTVAKALQDGRLLDLPLSVPFYKLVLGQELDLYDIKSIDSELGSSLQEMQVLVRRKQYLDAASEPTTNLFFRNSRIEDLCLDFTLPGYPEYELMQNGSNVMVNLENLEDYLSLVVDATLKTGIAAQMEAFRAGFNQVFPLSSLLIFNEEELDYLLCGRRELWVPETLADNIKFDHGYTAASHPIRHLLEILGELNAEEQRAFLRFVTGAPRLPPGGLAALSPKLTIVRKHPTGTSGANNVLGTTPPGAASALGTTLADGDLPSVMTCANYLKLPPYSCKEVMQERLLYAIAEGQGSFDLS
ncbi:hypothetical protein O6H91_03G040800 [Diphasiastrum complanatum]|uniref:Uncharacterized protein n=2 Tax=Diphasiastrum complanatum TaxID=34168 RepID=A0ACC2E5G9_DIPCM|nr:hypothetical protein O6H91_03G040800 [Diphasiastrum complanatum]KAJ7561780.1 hypothetical protein O6H91_03G040800 [Diphasiastrum complanatum]